MRHFVGDNAEYPLPKLDLIAVPAVWRRDGELGRITS